LMIWYWVSDRTVIDWNWSSADFMDYRSSFRSGKRGKLLPTRSLRLGRRRRIPTLCEALVWSREIRIPRKSTEHKEHMRQCAEM
jgi:hypothetical protein